MAISKEYLQKRYVDFKNILAHEEFIIESVLIAASRSSTQVYHVVRPYSFTKQEDYERFVRTIGANLKKQGLSVGACKLTNKKGIVLSCLFISWG